MVGGDPALYEEVRPLLTTVGKNVFHVGPLGAGHAMKALNNLLSATCLAATCEAAAIAAKMGLSVERFIQVVQASSGRSSASEDKFPRFILPRTFNAGFTAGLMLKDLGIATDLGRAYQVPLFLAAEVQQLYAALVNQRGPQEDVTTIMRFIEELAQTTVAGDQVAQRA
jgi:3-hydroxyisobutyrate dehydrogenase-like beta-hydroxyacid dehydrogenase